MHVNGMANTVRQLERGYAAAVRVCAAAEFLIEFINPGVDVAIKWDRVAALRRYLAEWKAERDGNK